MIIAFITNKNSPRVIIVTGRVSTTKIGFKINLKTASTTATIIAERYPDTSTPGSTYAKTITATAVSNNFKIKFMFYSFNLKV